MIKKSLLFSLMLLIGIAVSGQNNKAQFGEMSADAPDHNWAYSKTTQSGTTDIPAVMPLPSLKDSKEANFVSVIPIGTSANAFGHFVGSRTANIMVNNLLNTVVYTHRLKVPNGNYIGYDVSFDRGLTWQVDQMNYDPTLPGYFPARYPLGGLYNPAGNTDPQQAYHTYVAPLLDGSLGVENSWGGIGFGAKQFADGAQAAQSSFNSLGDIHHYLPSAFAVQANGTAWFISDRNQWDGSSSTYDGILNIAKGFFNEDAGMFEYEVDEWPFDVQEGRGINDIEIAFSPDGMTGWICLLTTQPELLPYTSYHPIFFKTTDGGENWSDPIEVQLGGEAGLEAIKNFITDEDLIAFYDPDPVPDRNEIPYYIGYYFDMVVDAWGNPHISGNVMLTNVEENTIYTNPRYNAPFHIWTTDGGETWEAFKLATLYQYKAEFDGDVTHYNHHQVSSAPDGTVIFFSWLDSDIDEATDNKRPDIYFRDFLPYEGEIGTHGEIENVTFLSAAMWKANWANMPERVFEQLLGDNTVEYTIPWVYMQLDETLSGNDPVQFNYIPDFKKVYSLTGLQDKVFNEIATVSQNYPNPFSLETQIKLTLIKESAVTLEVFSLTGQKVSVQHKGSLQAGTHTLTIDGSNLKPGIYFYTLTTANQKVTKKMIVK
ncbi:MAG: T9SS type A sorting domain-containing protein [Bacteroidales bacterium]|nr:T9SS type A sorting domain-containing protein [Bacteroidales bacterium]MDD3700849.1 T9SS type A sorting domain-containing protein [Bacteroidales bacterium]MDY0369434.1 T9SS type A sorting domain-containing protein [Bacteroidales bacterium]